MLHGLQIEVCPYILPGVMMRWSKILVRHMSEFLLALTGAAWHPNGHCPSWTDSAECRCMVE